MNFTFNAYALTLIICGSITLFLSYYIYKRNGGAVRWFGLMMLSNAIWSLGYGFELASSTLPQMKFFIDIEYIGITFLPLNWFLFCLEMSGKDKWYRKKLNILALLTIPVVTTILVWTNDYHHLHYKNLYVSNVGGSFPMLGIVPGISYKLFTIYFYALLAIGSYLLISKFREADPIYKKQNYSIIIAALIPWLANLSYLLGFRPMGNLDITPFAFILTIFLISIGIYRLRLFDILPVAREKVLELMQDGFIVLDRHYRIIDYNFAFKKYIADKNKKIIGAEIQHLLPEQPLLLDFLQNKRSGKMELSVGTKQGLFDLEADIRYLDDNKLNNEATIIKLQDLTALRQEALKSQEQAEELQRLNQLKDRIFSIISHDLRGPLVNLSEVIKMILNDTITIEEFKNISPTLSKDILYTTDLLENILHWSRSQLKGYGINKEFFELRSLIVNEINYHLPSATVKKIGIIDDVFPGAMVYADMIMMQIVVRNILNNAIKFCNDGCEIHISAAYHKLGFMHLHIKDNGIGMSKNTVKKLFQGENTSTRGTMNEKGTGLGLLVCKEFMQRNGGDITVKSETGKGTAFCITIPTDVKTD